MTSLRAATAKDRKTFMTLWRAYQQDQYDSGGDILPNQHNAMEALSLFQGYTNGYLKGVVVLAEDDGEPVGVAMIGEGHSGGGPCFELRGQSWFVTVWGDYVVPSHRRRGVSHKMLNYCQEYLHGLGARTYLLSAIPTEEAEKNAEAYGSVKTGTLYAFYAKEK